MDDDSMQRTLIRAALEKFGFYCEEARNGDECLAILKSVKPDLVILGVMMPGRNGFEVCAEIRSTETLESLPVLMVTGLDDIKSIERAFEVGATNFLTKPINPKLVGYQIKYMLRANRMERQIAEAKRLAEESSMAKSQFLANMSHELRTPLNAIIGFSEMISSEILGPVGNSTYAHYAKDINESGTHLRDIINDILDISKIESSQFKVRLEACDLAALLERACCIVFPHADEAGVSLVHESEPRIGAFPTDELRLKQVLINLLSNAVKFTPRGGRVALRAELSGRRDIVITVTDSGIGIPSDQIAQALSMFGQVDADLNRKYEGTGLGLPLAKLITERLGGVFALESAEGRGTTVTLTFPKQLLSAGTPVNSENRTS